MATKVQPNDPKERILKDSGRGLAHRPARVQPNDPKERILKATPIAITSTPTNVFNLTIRKSGY